MAAVPGWEPISEYPYPPANVQVFSPFLGGCFDIRWDNPLTLSTGPIACGGKSNMSWNIVGVNIYRSDTGERGPYFRLNNFPLGMDFYRDCTDNALVDAEVVDWGSQWVSKANSPNSRAWVFRTRWTPIVKREGQSIPADNPTDVTVTIDGQTVVPSWVNGVSGEITLINTPTYDPSTERLVDPILPKADGSSVVQVTYHRPRNFVKTDLEQKAKIFYRVTSVAVDPTGTTPSGYVETPLGYTQPASPMDVESLDYIWREAQKRNQWILEQGGERVYLFIRRNTGVSCPCQWDEQLFEYSKQPLNRCLDCYGTGFLRGYEGPIPLIVGPDDAERAVRQTPTGRRLEHTYEVWTGVRPLVSQRDFILKQTGERYSIGPVRRPAIRGLPLQQHFNIAYLDEQDIRYKIPMVGTSQQPWPETRYTKPEEAPCVGGDPFPVGYTYEPSPMATEVAKVPDGREQRGRSPVYANLTYGGKGGS